MTANLTDAPVSSERIDELIQQIRSGIDRDVEYGAIVDMLTELKALRETVEKQRKALENRDSIWILAMAGALGLGSNYKVPIVPEIEPFKQLFESIKASNNTV